ncbi:MAG: hypothetical protein ACTSX8_04910, partial [Alphaproteobacteria bacterium]
FPPCDQVVPWSTIDDADNVRTHRACPHFNAKYLADACLAPVLVGHGDKTATLRIVTGDDELDPAAVISDCVETDMRAIIVIMPMRV